MGDLLLRPSTERLADHPVHIDVAVSDDLVSPLHAMNACEVHGITSQKSCSDDETPPSCAGYRPLIAASTE